MLVDPIDLDVRVGLFVLVFDLCPTGTAEGHRSSGVWKFVSLLEFPDVIIRDDRVDLFPFSGTSSLHIEIVTLDIEGVGTHRGKITGNSVFQGFNCGEYTYQGPYTDPHDNNGQDSSK